MNYIFDVDDTLTPSRYFMNEEFAAWFEPFATHNKCYWVTGSPKKMTKKQLGSVYNLAVRAYQCLGVDVWSGGTHVRSSNWSLPDDARQWLQEMCEKEDCSLKVENSKDCIHKRPGMVNYSIIGSTDDTNLRNAFSEWESWNGSRRRTADQFNKEFPELQATVGGRTGIDIGPRGYDKSKILEDFDDITQIMFFGDKTFEGGNDYELAKAVRAGGGIVHAVEGWEETWKILKKQ
jgi:phosphomannomutase